MKKALLYIIIASAGFVSCKKDKTVFSQTPDERVNATLTAYQDSLTKSPYGWKGLIFPSGLHGGVFSFYFQFNNSNRVQMFSDFDSVSAVTMMESSYRLKALQQPCLIFDTYCYVTVLADPDASVNGGAYGSGLSSDFEFAIDSVKDDTIKLTGRLHGSKAILVKATQQEKADYYNKKHTNRLFDNINKYITYFKRVTIGGVQYEVLVNTKNRTVTISWIDGNGNAHVVTTGYYYTATGVGFAPPVNLGTLLLYGFDNITWDNTNTVMTVTVNGTVSTVAQAGQPISPDVNAPGRWWQYAVDQGGYWSSYQGFHQNGVDDAFGITQIASFYSLIYWPGYGTSGNTAYDVAGFTKLTNNALSLPYGHAYRQPTTYSTGRTVFAYLGYLGTIPSADSIPVAKTRVQFSDGNGYYFVQKDSTHYDMVGAKDAKTWMHWQY